MNPSSAQQRSGRRQLVLVASVFFLPLVAAFFLYFSASWRPPVGVQHGQLIDPPRPLPEMAFSLPDLFLPILVSLGIQCQYHLRHKKW